MGQKSLRDKIEYVVRGHLLNWPWRASARRGAVREDVVAQIVMRRFRHALRAVKNVPVMPVVPAAGEKIFSIWLQGEENAPELVKACFRSVRRHCSQELVVLDEKTLDEYITLPAVIVDKYRRGIISPAHFADICRLELLYKYGGFWMDATLFAVAPIPDRIVGADFFVYMVGDVGFKYSLVQNCFIRARRGAYLVAAWRAMVIDYWVHNDVAPDYFMHQLMFRALVSNDARAAQCFAQMPQETDFGAHVLWHVKDARDLPFDQKSFDEWTGGAFFQKLTFRGMGRPVPGSFADAMIKM